MDGTYINMYNMNNLSGFKKWRSAIYFGYEYIYHATHNNSHKCIYVAHSVYVTNLF